MRPDLHVLTARAPSHGHASTHLCKSTKKATLHALVSKDDLAYLDSLAIGEVMTAEDAWHGWVLS